MEKITPEPAITRLPTELWHAIIDILLYDRALCEPSITDPPLYKLTASTGEKRVKAIAKNIQLVCKSWRDYADVAHAFIAVEYASDNLSLRCSRCWLAYHRAGTFLQSCGILSHALKPPAIHPRISSITTVMLIWNYPDPSMTLAYLCSFYQHLTMLQNLMYLCMKINLDDSRFLNIPVARWQEVEAITLPKVKFLDFGFGDYTPIPCLLPLSLPSLLELSMEDYESGEVVGMVLPHLLGRSGQHIRKLALDSVTRTKLPKSFATLLPNLEHFRGDLPMFILDLDGGEISEIQLPQTLREVVHIGNADEDLWKCDVVHLLSTRLWDAIDSIPGMTLELKNNWEWIMETNVEDAVSWRQSVQNQVQLMSRAGVRLQDETKRQWAEVCHFVT